MLEFGFNFFQKSYSATVLQPLKQYPSVTTKNRRRMMEGGKKQYITLIFNCLMQELVYKEGIPYIIKLFNLPFFPEQEWYHLIKLYSSNVWSLWFQNIQELKHSQHRCSAARVHLLICSCWVLPSPLWVQSCCSEVSEELWLLMYPALAQCHLVTNPQSPLLVWSSPSTTMVVQFSHNSWSSLI